METILSILTVLFIMALIGVALTFGFALLIWFVLFALIVTGVVALKQLWYRWRFLRGANTPSDDLRIIEVEYEDISNKK